MAEIDLEAIKEILRKAEISGDPLEHPECDMEALIAEVEGLKAYYNVVVSGLLAAIERLQAELAELKGRRCQTCVRWDSDQEACWELRDCVDVEADTGKVWFSPDPPDPPDAWACGSWESKESPKAPEARSEGDK